MLHRHTRCKPRRGGGAASRFEGSRHGRRSGPHQRQAFKDKAQGIRMPDHHQPTATRLRAGGFQQRHEALRLAFQLCLTLLA